MRHAAAFPRRRPWIPSLLGALLFSQSLSAPLLFCAAPQEPSKEKKCVSGCTKTLKSGLTSGDPIAANSGAFHYDLPLLSLGGPSNPAFTLYYRSDLEHSPASWSGVIGVPGGFWWSPLENLEFEFDQYWVGVTVQIWNGDVISFTWDGGQWVPSRMGDPVYGDNAYPARWLLKETTGYFYLMDPIGEQVHIFQKINNRYARISRILDRNGNRLTYSYAAATHLHPSRVEDGLGRFLDFTYQTLGIFTALVRVTDQAGRQITLAHENFGADNGSNWTLRSVTDPAGKTTTFRYAMAGTTPNLVTRAEKPRGNAPYAQQYGSRVLNWGERVRVVSQQDAAGNTTRYAYDPASFRVAETRPDGTTNLYEHFGRDGPPRSLTDASGKTMRFSRDEATNRLTGVTDRAGDASLIGYHADTGLVASYTDALGNTTAITHTAQVQTFTNPINDESVAFTFYNQTRVTYADGTREDYAYDGKGNIVTFADGRGDTRRYTYNDRGQPLTITNPAGGVTTFTYNADGTLASSTDSDPGIGATSYAHDTAKRLASITHPGGSTARFTYDPADRPLTLVDERGKTTTIAYDANGNRISERNPLNQVHAYTYDTMDRLSGFTDPLGRSAAYTYDALSRLASHTDRNGNTTSYGYNSRSWLVGLTDPAGKTWTQAYDDEGVAVSQTSPRGFASAFQTDRLGRTTRITDPMGQTVRGTYDGVGRLATFTDRMSRTTAFSYDAAGRLTGATRPATGTAAFTRNSLGRVTRITDPRGKNWDFDYSAMGRPLSHTDPLGKRRTYSYDSRGRLSTITFPDGLTAALTYDAARNITQIACTGGPALNYTYDDAGRLLTATGIALSYDARGDVTGTQDGNAVFGATFDNARRLATASYDGQATVTYTYDTRDLLTRVADSLSGSWMGFAYDDDGRLTEITRSNAVTTAFTYDSAGRVTRIRDGTHGDQQYTLNAEGEPTQVVRSLPLDPAPTPASRIISLDDASQISAAGYAYDARGQLTAAPGRSFAYDAASRLIAVRTIGTQADSEVQYAYNGLDELRSRTAGGATTTYYRNHAMGLAPIVAEKSDQAYKRFYVYTPEGALLYSIDAGSGAPRFYHFDRVGSTLFLTDRAGSVTDAYAYDPYGTLLGRTGASDQPFTYIGRYGVRWEPLGGLYDMRARHYDPVTARFLARDPVWPVLDDPAALNPYQYAYQNPLRHIDPTGKAVPAILIWLGIKAAKVAGSALAGYIVGSALPSGVTKTTLTPFLVLQPKEMDPAERNWMDRMEQARREDERRLKKMEQQRQMEEKRQQERNEEFAKFRARLEAEKAEREERERRERVERERAESIERVREAAVKAARWIIRQRGAAYLKMEALVGAEYLRNLAETDPQLLISTWSALAGR